MSASNDIRLSGARLAVLRSRVDGVARKMTNALLRSGRSGVLNRAKDLSCCIVTTEGALLSAAESLPIHVLSGPDLMACSLKQFHPVLRAGDAFLHNSPYHGCSHAADHTILVPVFDSVGIHRATVLVKAHQADIGNSRPTTYFAQAGDVYEEGALIFPAVRVQKDYLTNEDIVRMCELRIRVPEQWRGDFLAMLGAARTGEKELVALGEEVGWDTLTAFTTRWFDYSEGQMGAAIAALPAGCARHSSTHDSMPGTPAQGLTIGAAVRVDPAARRIEVDLRENPDCLPSGLNVSEACARTAAMIGVFNSLPASIPKNAGSFRCINVLLREHCVAGGARHPASCSVATTNISDRIAAAVQLAMADHARNTAVAEIGAINPPHKGVISGRDPRTARGFVDQLFLGSTGGPASAHGDAWLTYSHAGNGGLCFIDSVEMVELHYPLRVHSRRLLPDTEGAGMHRGAFSLQVEFEATAPSLSLAYVSDGADNPAQGVHGGGAGGPARQYREMEGVRTPLPGASHILLEPGVRIVSVGTGGGGYGDPMRRDPARISQEVADRLISLERARLVYGVALKLDGKVDEAETEQLRNGGEQSPQIAVTPLVSCPETAPARASGG